MQFSFFIDEKVSSVDIDDVVSGFVGIFVDVAPDGVPDGELLIITLQFAELDDSFLFEIDGLNSLIFIIFTFLQSKKLNFSIYNIDISCLTIYNNIISII